MQELGNFKAKFSKLQCRQGRDPIARTAQRRREEEEESPHETAGFKTIFHATVTKN